MDKNENQKLHQTRSQINKHHQLLKMTSQLLVSAFLLSFLLSYSSDLSHFFHDFNFHLTMIFPLFSQTIERKYMFLICNGIVAFLITNLSFTSSSSSSSSTTGSDHIEPFRKTNGDCVIVKPVYEMEAPVVHEEVAMESTVGPLENVARAEKQDDEQENRSMNIEPEGRESRAMIKETEEEEEELEESGLLIPPSAAEDGDEVPNVSTEELNRKFDEFIRKIKEEIRLQATRQEVTVM